MKQILSKCFCKMKRVALTLFAALCVGSVWAEENKPQTRTVEIDGGYKIFGLGENRNETAVVFTRTGLSRWTVPIDIKNAQFLVVGGGGGGAGARKKYPGAGGGGGGVATGFVTKLETGSVINVIVGKGGSAGIGSSGSDNDKGRAGDAEDTYFSVGNEEYVRAGKGGSGQGYDRYPGKGASNSGNCSNAGTDEVEKLGFIGSVGEGVPVSEFSCFGHAGGYSYNGGDSKKGSGGGGGAGSAAPSASSSGAGAGGEGFYSSITGERLDYGSGGGGGANGIAAGLKGGAGAGDGSAIKTTAGGTALANRGGGGGGGGTTGDKNYGNGGAGGSGIVVFRYVSTHIDNFISPDELESPINTSINNNTFVFNGQNQSPLSDDLLNSNKYSITGDVTARDVGTYTFSITPNEGYAWDDETRTPKEFTWTIHSVNPACGYVKNIGDEVVVVFTNHNGSTIWTVPYNLNNVEFLVVGGGAGGGADARSVDKSTGGAGGGGGGVVTGLVNFVKGDCLTVKVGAGGNGGRPGKSPTDLSNQYGASYPGGESQFSINDCEMYVKAYGGGRDQGVGGNGTTYASYTYYQGGTGGSNAGSRGNCKTEQSDARAGDSGDSDNRLVTIDLTMAHKGGNGETGTMDCWGYPAAGGGGGALAAGQNADSHWQNDWGDSNNHWHGGAGGEGLPSAITGELLVYGSGGGGATTMESADTMNPTHIALGGTGAGNGGNAVLNTDYGRGTDALANQGGGGGGSSGTVHNGGNGGSGIVVFRYKVYAAEVNSMPYDTLSEAVTAAANGATITVLNDCTADTACVIANKTLTIDLNGKTVKANDTDAATDGNGVFWVQAGGVLTLEDSSEDKSGTVDGNGGNGYKMAIWADGGKVVINAGNYVNENDGTHTQYDLIYAKNRGEIVINGGIFKCDTPRWTLNSHNTNTGTFIVTGGRFYQYNPTDFDTDEAVTTWCDAKYRAEADGDWYVIKEGYTVTEESAATVTADTEAEALAQVDFSVTPPKGIDAAVYEKYFKLVATETAEGSKTWTVALALKDELKPVIAETTPAIIFNDDGTVTVNIKNELPGLNYGVRYATTVEAVDTAEIVPGFTVTPAEGDTAGFFKVVVDFKEIK